MLRRLAILLCVLALGCGDEVVSDIVSVPARPPEPTPVSAFRSTLGESAVSLAFVGEYIESDGSVNVLFSDGSRLSGNVDVDTGEFDLLLELPAGYHLVSVHDAGTFDLSGSYITGAEYREDYTYLSGTEARWEISLTFDARMILEAKDIDRGTRVHSEARFLEGRTTFTETWDLANGYHEDIRTEYRDSDPFLTQEWVRDELATGVSPDRTGSISLGDDGSGEGRLEWFYDNQITSVYEILQEADGDATATLVYEDPDTLVTPDGIGTYSFEQDNSGEGTYTESYDDGSELTEVDVYGYDDSVTETFTFDDAGTSWSPDVDGTSYLAPDGSGNGEWRRYDSAGVIETCEYELDTAGAISHIDCS
jgi:hypothetical protein